MDNANKMRNQPNGERKFRYFSRVRLKVTYDLILISCSLSVRHLYSELRAFYISQDNQF